MTDPQKDEHIEELLSKLQGIFGKLSHSEEEAAKQKADAPPSKEAPPSVPPPTEPPIPKAAPVAPIPTPPAPVTSEPASIPAPKMDSPPIIQSSKAAPFDPLQMPVPSGSTPAAAPAASAVPGITGTGKGAMEYESQVPTGDPDRILVPTAVYFPTGKIAEAKSLAQKLEMMAPKFTKVTFRLQVVVFLPYDPKTEWKDGIVQKVEDAHFQTVFVVVDRALEDARKKAIAADLEAKGVYFQDVPMPSIEKKAYYTDVLLGLVFFFDSHKPPAPPEQGA